MKIFLYLLLGLVSLVGIAGLVIPKDFKLEREIIVDRPLVPVFESLRFLKTHDRWSAWSKKDPTLKKEFTGEDGAAGFRASWASQNEEMGTAEQEIIEVINNERFLTEIRFTKPFEASFLSYLKTESVSESKTKVIMGMSDEIPFPMNVMSFVFNVCLGNQQKIIKDMDDSLKGFKTIMEQSP